MDVSSNDFTEEHIDLFRIAVSTSKAITTLDLRRNPGFNESSDTAVAIDKVLLENETKLHNGLMFGSYIGDRK